MRSAATWGVASIILTLLLTGGLESTSLAQSDAPPRTSMPPASVQTAPDTTQPAAPWTSLARSSLARSTAHRAAS